ncbi:serine acetyltransferase [Flavobacterium silvisoli]|uniref:Serine acetyltransferase n=1 Tax=Flavobacterium silvisoli TaxID=2529433 RepID=A0A4Q9YZD2_9FLAO|nr:serine acetyltransferase [Flavobacterium silvisoli]TBX69242.1 serine acetyltransferase [Flavobacterium silvisoli]
MTLFQLIRSDYLRYKKYGANFWVIVFFTQGFWATFQYRIAHYCCKKVTFKPLKMLLFIPLYLWQKIIELTTGISIPYAATIGHSFYIGHFGGIVLNARTVIGHNCNIAQGVTIGVSGLAENRGVPKIGNHVFIGVNSVVAGKITIADHVMIGACSLVVTDIEEGSVYSGVPAVKISDKGSKGYI